MIILQQWGGVQLKHLHLQKHNPDFGVPPPFVLCSGENFPQCTDISHWISADLEGHPFLLVIHAKGIRSQNLTCITS